MAFDVTNNINSALASGMLGLDRAQQGISQAAVNIAQRNGQASSPQDLLADAAAQQIGQTKQLLPSGGDSLTNDLISLKLNSNNALASAKVIGVANDTIGRIIDELA